jgi:hypothetical protein
MNIRSDATKFALCASLVLIPSVFCFARLFTSAPIDATRVEVVNRQRPDESTPAGKPEFTAPWREQHTLARAESGMVAAVRNVP